MADSSKRLDAFARQHSSLNSDGSPLNSPLPGLSSVLHRQSPTLKPSTSQALHLQSKQPPTAETAAPPPQPRRAQLKQTSAAVSTAVEAQSSTTAPPTKSSRYLREMDRRAILQRLQAGEKQAALAKEYHVSRAAICNLNKHRDEVLSRRDGNPLAKHPKKPKPRRLSRSAWSVAQEQQQEQARGLLEIKSRAVALLLTTLRKKHAGVGEFRRCSDRLLRLVLEEALAHVPVKTVEIFLPSRVSADGVALEHPPCAVSMEPSGCPMLDLFRQMEPEQPTGFVSFGDLALDSVRDVHVRLDDAALPVRLNYHNVFLLDHVVTSAELVVAVVRRLQERGAVEAMVSLVALIATQDAVDKLHAALPAVKIVVAHVDRGDEELVAPPRNERGGQDSAVPVGASTTDMILDRLEQVYHGYPPANAY